MKIVIKMIIILVIIFISIIIYNKINNKQLINKKNTLKIDKKSVEQKLYFDKFQKIRNKHKDNILYNRLAEAIYEDKIITKSEYFLLINEDFKISNKKIKELKMIELRNKVNKINN